MLQCIPIQKNWVPVGGKAIEPGHCFPKSVVENIIIVQGVISIVTDFIGAAFPVMLLWNAKLNMRVKVALNLLMGLGIITGSVCIIRTSYSWEIRSDDETWVGVGNALTRMYTQLPPPTLVYLANYNPKSRSQFRHHRRLRPHNASPLPPSPLPLQIDPRHHRLRATHLCLQTTLVYAPFPHTLVQAHLPRTSPSRQARRSTFRAVRSPRGIPASHTPKIRRARNEIQLADATSGEI